MNPTTDRTARTLPLLAALLGLGGCALWPSDPELPDEPLLPGDEPPAQVIDPQIERREVVVPKIDTENFEAGVFLGVLSVEDLQSDLIYGLRGAFHVTEDIFVEAEYARSTVSDEIRRTIGQPFFPSETEDLDTYSLAVGYNLLPGELFVGTRYAMTSTVYVLGGAGNTSFNDEDYMTYSLGFGIKVLPTDWLSLRLEGRDRLWESDLLGDSKLTHNFEATLGVAVFF